MSSPSPALSKGRRESCRNKSTKWSTAERVQAVILDTGPIVGLLSDDDEHHAASVASIGASGRKGRKLCTTWTGVGEAYTLFPMRIAPARSAEAALVLLRLAKTTCIDLLPPEYTYH